MKMIKPFLSFSGAARCESSSIICERVIMYMLNGDVLSTPVVMISTLIFREYSIYPLGLVERQVH